VIGAAAVLSFVAVEKAGFLAILPQRIFSQLDVFALMAMVLFMKKSLSRMKWMLLTALITCQMRRGRLKIISERKEIYLLRWRSKRL
jgi:hypothetical protein